MTQSASASGPTTIPTPTPTPAPTVAPTQDTSPTSAASIGLATGSRPKIKIALKRNGENGWVPSNASSEDSVNKQPDLGVASVVGNVSSFLSGIRASFRQDSVYVSGKVHPSKQNTKDY